MENKDKQLTQIRNIAGAALVLSIVAVIGVLIAYSDLGRRINNAATDLAQETQSVVNTDQIRTDLTTIRDEIASGNATQEAAAELDRLSNQIANQAQNASGQAQNLMQQAADNLSLAANAVREGSADALDYIEQAIANLEELIRPE